MSKPRLIATTVSSIESLLADLQPADYLGTSKEAGVRYMTDLVKYYRDPKSAISRRKNAARINKLAQIRQQKKG